MNLAEEYIEEFVSQIEEKYQNQTRLGDIVDLRDYEDSRDAHREFQQIGLRPNLPKEFFYRKKGRSVHYGAMVKSFVEKVCNSEMVFVLEQASQSAKKHDTIIKSDGLSRSDIIATHEYVTQPNCMFLPNDRKYKKLFREWVNEGFGRFKGGKRYVQAASEIEVIFMPQESNINSAILLDAQKVKVIQKRYRDAEKPDWLNHYFDRDLNSQNSRIMTYFGQQFRNNPDEFDFFVRVLLTNPDFKFGANCEIQLPDS